jgi:hypothetical protein
VYFRQIRASISLTHHWRDQGKVQQARELLAPVYGWFTEGFDTLDLKEAKALPPRTISTSAPTRREAAALWMPSIAMPKACASKL